MRPDSVRGEEKIWREWWVELLKGGGWRYGSGRGLTSGADPRLNAEECLLDEKMVVAQAGVLVMMSCPPDLPLNLFTKVFF